MWAYNSTKNCKENLLDCKAAFSGCDPKTVALIFAVGYNSYKKAVEDFEVSKFFNSTRTPGAECVWPR